MTGIVMAANGLPHVTSRALRSIHDHTRGFRLYLFDGVPWPDLTKIWNRGIRSAHADDCEYVVLINNDVAVYPGWLEPLLGSYHEKACAVGPVSNAPGDCAWQQGGPGETAEWRRVERLNGFCFAARTQRLIDEPLDEVNHPFLGSEDEWFQRAAQKWGKPIVARHSYVHHWRSSTRSARLGAP